MLDSLLPVLCGVSAVLLTAGVTMLLRIPEHPARVGRQLWSYGLMMAGALAAIIALWVADVGRSVDKAMPTATFAVVVVAATVSMVIIARRANRARSRE
ncbi:hypothetical protein [Rathayibacter sp. AY1C5]|uniref:hypothetical protein n=1 Tax=Rathayibacter sp. AY1C5 TaxID=2080538 RepID=UPI000CE77F16|nr:hypothetical protein [Rathayibacter sp. AY1C5]PPG56514.1 hypothetical protein C5C57_14720 [Rathayibacter sp. AY1C5]